MTVLNLNSPFLNSLNFVYLSNFRLVLIKRPSHYKTMITKTRLHIAYAILCIMSLIELGGCFLFLRKSLSSREVCTTVNIINTAGIYAILMLNCVLWTFVMIVSFIWIMMQLKKRKRDINNRMQNPYCTDSKLNRPILISTGIYICLYVVSVFSIFAFHFHHVLHMLIFWEVAMLLFYMTTVLNPFIYYATMKDFRHGYKKILLCKATGANENQQIELAVVEC